MKAIRITYNVYFTNDEILVKTSPVHVLSRDFVFTSQTCFTKERFEFEKKVADFRSTIKRLYKNVSVDKSIFYCELNDNEI